MDKKVFENEIKKIIEISKEYGADPPMADWFLPQRFKICQGYSS